MEQFTTAAGAVGLVKAGVDLIKYARAKDANGVITQLAVYLMGIGVVMLVRASDFASRWDVGGIPLSEAQTGTAVLAGLGLGAVAMLANDGIKAVDGSQSARKPPLVPDPPKV